MHPCRGCGQPFQRDPYQRRYCDACMHPACKRCGQPFAVSSSNIGRQVYCSSTCRSAAFADNIKAGRAGTAKRGRRPPPPPSCRVYFPTCKACGNLFTSPRAGRGYCSRECRSLGTGHYPTGALVITVCECGRPFAYVSKAGCVHRCDQCRADAARAAKRKASRINNRRRRAAKRGAGLTANVDNRAIIERDGWRCHLCGGRISKRYPWPHPDSVEVDHLIPLSRGGDHVAANMAAAHRRCNQAKGAQATGRDQLRLFG